MYLILSKQAYIESLIKSNEAVKWAPVMELRRTEIIASVERKAGKGWN